MITLKEVECIHEILIDKFGGKKGLRDKAAAILESIISNHPFLDGNKRTAYVVARLVLRANNLDIKATQDDKYEFVISAARGEIRFDQI